MKKNVWKNLENKIGLMLLFVAVIASIGIYLINYTQFYSLILNDLEQDAVNLHSYAEEVIDMRIFTEINTIEDQNLELYINTHRQLDEIRRMANAKFLYTIKLNDNNEYIYLIDGLDKDDENFSHAGMLVEDEFLAELDLNMKDEIRTSEGIMITDYGYLYSMSFPFHDNEGNVIGVIGIDFDVEQLYHSMNRARRMSIFFTLILGLIFTVSTLFTVKKIVKHTEKVFNRMIIEIKQRDETMQAVNRIATLLLTVDSNENAPIQLIKSLEIIGRTTNADRVHIWQNEMKDDELYYVCTHSWFSEAEEKNAVTFKNFKAAYNDKHLWKRKVMSGEYINSVYSEMPPDDREYFRVHGASLKSAAIIPLFLEDQFWGMFSIDHCKIENTFNEEEIEILRSVGLMIVTIINRIKMREEIDTAYRHTKILLDRTPLCCQVWDANVNKIECNEEAVRLFGFRDKQEYLKRSHELYPEYQPDGMLSVEKAKRYVLQAFAEGDCGPFNWTYNMLDGTIMPAEVVLKRIKYEEEYVIAGYTRDLREHYKMMAEIKRHDEIMQAVNKIASLLLTVDSKENARTLLVKSLEIIGRTTYADRVHIWESEEIDGELYYVCTHHWFSERGEKEAAAFTNLRARHHDMPWGQKLMQNECIGGVFSKMEPHEQDRIRGMNLKSFTVIPLFLDGRFWGGFSIDHCEMEYVFNEEEIEILRSVGLMIVTEINRNVMKAAAEHSSQAKSIFLSQMSHEIRTPMNAILGIAQMRLRNDTLSQDVENGFVKIYESGSLLMNIINDILDFSQIDAGKLEIIHTQYNVPNMINDVVQMNRLRYDSKPIEFKLIVDENMPVELIGDELRIKQILNNLLSNAYKYTDSGVICFSISVKDEDERNNETVRLTVKVSDTGQGMNESQLSSLYEAYSRFNLDVNSGIAGTGLGMNITKRLVRAMNGEINAKSEIGKGTEFTVSLPQKRCGLQVCGSDIAAKLQAFSFHNKLISKTPEFTYKKISEGRVLIVDDININLLIAREMLQPYGLHIETADNGLEAVEKIKNDGNYDIVLMDHMMPVMDGLKATKLIREWEASCSEASRTEQNQCTRIPIVALTANAVSGQEEMFLANGFDAFIAKPIDSSLLDQVVMRFIKNVKHLDVKHLDESQLANKTIDFFKMEKIFISDAENAISVLGKLSKEISSLEGKNLESYIIAVHGIKSALTGIGEKSLSNLAYKLEQAGKNRNYNLMASDTPVLMEALLTLVKDFKSEETISQTSSSQDISGDVSGDISRDVSQEDTVFLHERLEEIKTACEDYNVKSAKKALADLKQKTWPRRITDIIEEISIDLLCGEFKKVLITIEKYKAEI
ncbi:MAG: ATP-binding protein [Treponema sp.]|nr:ATP-binding protein [Treponema sp.]